MVESVVRSPRAQSLRPRRDRRRKLPAARPPSSGDRGQTDLIGSVAHELRRPLAAIRGYVTTVLEYGDRLSPAETSEFLRGADQACRYLDKLVEDLLTVSRVGGGRLSFQLERVAVFGLVRQILAVEEVMNGDQRFIVSLPRRDVTIVTDPARLRQVLHNLIDNARKYSGSERPIEVIATTDESGVSISVRDYGVGVPEPELERIFERFYRAEGARRFAPEGSGLGLAICRGIIEAQGGRIWAEKPEDNGLRLLFTLPYGRMPTSSGGSPLPSPGPSTGTRSAGRSSSP